MKAKSTIFSTLFLIALIFFSIPLFCSHVYSKDWMTPKVVSTTSTGDSLEPSLAVGPDGTVHLAWEDQSNFNDDYSSDVFYSSMKPGTEWTSPTLISTRSTGCSFRPSLAVGLDGTVHLAWEDQTVYYGESEDNILYRHLPPGSEWTGYKPINPINQNTTYHYYPSLAVGPDGTVHIAWEEYGEYGDGPFDTWNIFYSYLVPNTDWTAPKILSTMSNPLSTSHSPSLAVGPDGTVHITWIQQGPTSVYSDILYSSLAPGSDWTTPKLVTTYSIDYAYPSLAVGPDGTVYVAWQDLHFYTSSDIFYSCLAPPGSDWTAPKLIATSNRGNPEPSLAVGPDGTVHLAWEDQSTYNSDIIVILYSSMKPGTEWTSPIVLSKTSTASSYNPSLDVNFDGTVHVAWEDETNYYNSGNDLDIFYSAFDINAPSTMHDYDNKWHNADFTITLSATDDFSGVAETCYKVNSEQTLRNVSEDGQPLINTSGADNTLEYWSVDETGNEELPHNILTIKLDKTKPTGSFEFNVDNNSTSSEFLTLSLFAEDPESGVTEMCFSNFGGTTGWTEWEPYATTKDWTLTSGDGTKNVFVQFRNGAGLVYEYTDSIVLNTGDQSTLDAFLWFLIPIVGTILTILFIIIYYRRKKCTILFLAANPNGTTELELAEEANAISDELYKCKFRNRFNLEQRFEIKPTEISEQLLRHKPKVVHFSGHGSEAGEIILEDKYGSVKPVDASAISDLFGALKDEIRCVVLNACYSEVQAKLIANHIDCVIGMSKAIGDDAAIEFAKGFYRAIGYGKDVETAFELGCNQIDLQGWNEEDTPRIIWKNNEPKKIVLV